MNQGTTSAKTARIKLTIDLRVFWFLRGLSDDVGANFGGHGGLCRNPLGRSGHEGGGGGNKNGADCEFHRLWKREENSRPTKGEWRVKNVSLKGMGARPTSETSRCDIQTVSKRPRADRKTTPFAASIIFLTFAYVDLVEFCFAFKLRLTQFRCESGGRLRGSGKKSQKANRSRRKLFDRCVDQARPQQPAVLSSRRHRGL